jgi:hypothetical protein
MICSAANFFPRGIDCPPSFATTSRFSLRLRSRLKGAGQRGDGSRPIGPDLRFARSGRLIGTTQKTRAASCWRGSRILSFASEPRLQKSLLQRATQERAVYSGRAVVGGVGRINMAGSICFYLVLNPFSELRFIFNCLWRSWLCRVRTAPKQICNARYQGKHQRN